MDVNLRLLSERLRKVLLTGEEGGGRLPDGAAKGHLQNLLTQSELVSSLLLDYEDDIRLLLWQITGNEKIDSPELGAILKEINRFANESEKLVDSIIINDIMQQQQQGERSGSSSEEVCVCDDDDDALLRLLNKIIDIKQRIQQLQPSKSIPGREGPDSFSSTSESEKGDDKVLGVELEDKMEELLDLLIEGEDRISVVAIVGSPGFDKTAFAAEAYNSNYAKNYFDCRAWVPFNYRGMLEQIMKSVMPPSEWSEIMDKDEQLKRTALHDYLLNKRFLIVLDDLFVDDRWNDVRKDLPDHHNGSRVLTTLTDVDILKSCELENGERIQLDLVPVAKPLRAIYQGWPFVVLYYGSKSLQENMKDVTARPFRSLFWSIFELPLHLKLCCLYLCVCHEVFEISTRELYQLWIAEGFILDNSEATAEDYLNKLVNRDFIQVKKRRNGGKIKECNFPAVTWASSYLLAKATEFLHCLTANLADESLKDVKRLSLLDNFATFHSLVHFDTYVHSLLNRTSNNDHLASTDYETICKMFKQLRVLDLGARILNQFPSGIEHLVLLRYLKLNIPSLNSFPSSLCNLINLLTLDMPSSYIDYTPDEIWKMKKLRHLNCGYVKLPTHLGKYCNTLENLNFISALHASSCTLDILGRLFNLQSLLIYGDLSYYQCELSKSLCKLSCLESLKLLNESKTTQLSTLLLSNFQFPQTLTHLSLSNTRLKEDPMPTLEKLPQLEVLKLKQNSYMGRKLVCRPNGFPCLKVLHLKSMLWLDEWVMDTRVMSKLENIIINPCAYLKSLPDELWGIKTLCKLELWWLQPVLRQKLRELEDIEQYDIQIYPYGA